MISVKRFIFNGFQENTFLLYDETKECVIIDAGCYSDSEKQVIKNFILENSLKPTKAINTHFHIDHLLGIDFLKSEYNISIEGNKNEIDNINSSLDYASNYGFELKTTPNIDNYLCDNDTVKFGNSELKVLFVPGHSPGHLAFYSTEQKFVIVGDVLFKGSIGRTDLPGGDLDILMKSIDEKLLVLDYDTEVMPGHGSYTTIGLEKNNNPFITGRV